MQDADPSVVLNLIHAFRASRAMFAAVSLGVFDHLAVDKPMSCTSLAGVLGVEVEPLGRLLAGCCALGLVEREGECFRNAPAAERYLRRDSPDSLAGYVLYSGSALWKLWAHLDDAVREGTPRWEQAYGTTGPIFAHFFRTDDAKQEFIRGMHGFGRLSSPEVVRVFNLSRYRRIADLGSATGHLAIAACERYGRMSGVVFDLPEVVELARPHLASSPASARLEVVAGDFFRDPLPPADLYALGRILHDWGEEKIARLLGRIHAALPSGGGLLIAETVLDDDGLGPLHSVLQSLNMLVCTEGRERTAVEYEEMLGKAGFCNIEVRRTGAPLDAILAIRKE